MLNLCLPRDAVSVPFVRRICTSALRTLGVADSCVDDLELALSEACGNVIRHSRVGDDYEVRFRVDDTTCVLEVLDRGRGFEVADVTRKQGDVDSGGQVEAGRGIALMRTLMDGVHFQHRPEHGAVVRLEKVLTWARDHPLYEGRREARELQLAAGDGSTGGLESG